MTARIVIRSGTVLDRSGARRADVAIVGELVHRVRYCLAAAEPGMPVVTL